MVLTESLAAGTPVVALAEGGGPAEIITPEVGRLANATADSLADACCEALMLATMRMTFPNGDTKTMVLRDVEMNVPVDLAALEKQALEKETR